MAKKKPKRQCATMAQHFALLEANPSFRTKQHKLEHDARARMAKAFAAPTKPYKIQVVVHVLHRTAAENISDAQIKSQIATLNKDYRAKNSDKSKVPGPWKSLVADAMVEFELAKKDPKGKSTTGITRTETTITSFPSDDSMKKKSTGGVAPWNPTKYLNMWVCSLGGGLLGYAQFPGGPKSTDGVVMLNTAFGSKGTAKSPFNLGRTTTHEVGHYLNLRHIWGDTPDCSGGDSVNDTPNAATPNYDKPKFPHVSCCNGPMGDMFMNYMDYVDDDSMFMFTPGQVARMHATLDGVRKGLVK